MVMSLYVRIISHFREIGQHYGIGVDGGTNLGTLE